MSRELVVREAVAEDAVHAVITRAFGEEGQRDAALWAEVASSDAVRASLVAELDGEVVGHVGLSHAWLDARRELVDVWLLSPLSVAPERQREGIGTRLVSVAVARARSDGTPLLFLEGDPRYYGPRGFERGSSRGFVAPSARTPDAGFQVMRFATYEEWMSGQLIYRDVWWRYDAAGLRDPVLAEAEDGLS